MIGIVACALHIPSLEAAASARGLGLVPISSGCALPKAQVAIFGHNRGDPNARVAQVRAQGWAGPLMLILSPDCRDSIAQALDAGADDAVALPAPASEIAARLAARIRSQSGLISLGPLRIDTIERRVTRDGGEIRLLPREYALLVYLARQQGRCVGRAELLAALWGIGYDPGTNVVEVHVSRLRAKLDRGAPGPLLRTEPRRGYRLTDRS